MYPLRRYCPMIEDILLLRSLLASITFSSASEGGLHKLSSSKCDIVQVWKRYCIMLLIMKFQILLPQGWALLATTKCTLLFSATVYTGLWQQWWDMSTVVAEVLTLKNPLPYDSKSVSRGTKISHTIDRRSELASSGSSLSVW